MEKFQTNSVDLIHNQIQNQIQNQNQNLIQIQIQLIKPIQSHWTIYTKTNCIYCDRVKNLLGGESVITFVNCDDWLKNYETTQLFLNQMKNIIGYEYRTFPMVFRNNNFVGGFNETNDYLNSQKKNICFTDDF